jgi:imidazolonepropionase-like amidohydrolase
VVSVNRAADIETALDLAREFNLKIMVLGGAEAWKVSARLAADKVPVLTGALDNIPSSFATLGSRQENAGLLAKAGVPLIIVGSPGEAFNVRNIRQEAGNAVAYGLAWDAALRAVTLTVAEQFGVADRAGSLQAGRDANVVVWSGDPFEFATVAEHVFVRGRPVKRTSRQDELTEKYKRLLKAPR